MSDPVRRQLTVSEAVAATGLSLRTLQRRLSAWLDGDRSPYAIKCGRTGGDVGERLVDALDVERVAAQLTGDLAPEVTAEQFARQRGATNGV